MFNICYLYECFFFPIMPFLANWESCMSNKMSKKKEIPMLYVMNVYTSYNL